MPHAGELTQRLTFQHEPLAPTYGTRGEVITSPADVATVWAKVRPLTGRETIVARQQEAAVTHEVTIRYSSDVATIAPSYWALWGSNRLDVADVINVDQRNEWLIMTCALRVSAVTAPEFWSAYSPSVRYDASALVASAVTLDSTGRVSQLTDLSGNARHCVQATDTLRPTYSLMTGTHYGIKGHLTNAYRLVASGLNLTKPNTVWIVCKAPEGSDDRYWCGGDYSRLRISSADIRGLVGGAILNATTYGAYVANTVEIWTGFFSYDGQNPVARLHVNGAEAVSGACGSINPDTNVILLAHQTGGAGPTDGWIAEYIRFQSIQSLADRNAIGQHLATKYGLTWTTMTAYP